MAVLWLRFLKEVGENMKTLPPEMQANEHIRQAVDLCEEGAFTEGELEAYDKYWDIVRTEKSVKESALRKGRAEGEAKGRAEGEAKGRAEGRAESEAERTKLKTELEAKESQLEAMAARIAELEHLKSANN